MRFKKINNSNKMFSSISFISSIGWLCVFPTVDLRPSFIMASPIPQSVPPSVMFDIPLEKKVCIIRVFAFIVLAGFQ